MTVPTGEGQNEYRTGWPDVPGWRANMGTVGPEAVFHLADLCKPANLAASGYTFEEVLGWVGPEQRLRLRGRPIDPDRLVRFSAHRFILVQLPVTAIRLWPRAGGLSADWTDRYSVAELAEFIRTGAVEVPERAPRLIAILDAVRTVQGRHRIRAIPPIALPEFHASTRPDRPDTPWTLDDGSHRALALAVAGDTAVWCLTGDPLQAPPRRGLLDRSTSRSASSTADPVGPIDPIELAGTDQTDRAVVEAHLRSPHGQQDWSAAAPFAAERSAFVLSCLPLVVPPGGPADPPVGVSDVLDPPVNASELLDRIVVRRDHAVRAREAGLFRATDEVGRHLAGMVALAEYVRTQGTAAVSGVPSQVTIEQPAASMSPADTARAVAGDIARHALRLGGVTPDELEAAGHGAVASVRDLVERLAAGESVPSSDRAMQVITEFAPAQVELQRVVGPRGAVRWLAGQLSRAFVVASDAAQAGRDWAAVEAYAVRALVTTLRDGATIGPGLPVDTGLALANALNRIGVAHRARCQQDGVWRTHDAALHHRAALQVLAHCTEPTELLKPACVMTGFTTLLNLASAWTDEVGVRVELGADQSDFGLRRAVYLLRGMFQNEAEMTKTAMNAGDRRGVNIPDWIFAKLKNRRSVAWLRFVLLNDYAEIQWRAGQHEMLGRRLSRWQAEPHKKAEGVKDLLHRALLGHVLALHDLHVDPDRDRSGSVAEFWYWRHRKNLLAKVNELRKPGHAYAYILNSKDLREALPRYITDVPDEFRGHQMATLDTYSEQNYRVTLFVTPVA